MASFLWRIDLDKLGMTTSLLCAVHCVALPFLLGAGLVSGLSWINHPLVEWGLIILAIIIATKSLWSSYRHKHHAVFPLIAAISGCLLLIFSRIIPGSLEHFMTALGGIILAYAHYSNWLKLQAC